MKIFSDILEDDGVFEYLESRSLLERYRDSKGKILSGNFAKLDLKKRQPKNS
ncbi:MAG: hypothetical protein QG650_391 [Patescibacteria group bacterium]|nr:hypothetical protein [Patescibacteria group bacterium]